VEGSVRALESEKRQDPAREKFFAEFEASMAYVVNITARAERDLSPSTTDINATDSAAGRNGIWALWQDSQLRTKPNGAPAARESSNCDTCSSLQPHAIG